MIDANAYLGRYPFRETAAETVDDLLRLMDRCGIEQAVVSPFESVFYWDYELSDEKAYRDLRPHRDRLFQLGCVNPNYPGHLNHVRRCLDDFGVVGIKLHPEFHAFELADRSCLELVNTVGDAGRPVVIALRVEDERWYPPYVKTWPVSLEAVLELSVACPDVNFVACGVRPGPRSLGDLENAAPLERLRAARNVYFETSAVSTTDPGWQFHFGQAQALDPGDAFLMLVDALGPERVLFGTRMPVMEPMMTIVDLQDSAIEDLVRRTVVTENARRLFGIAQE